MAEEGALALEVSDPEAVRRRWADVLEAVMRGAVTSIEDLERALPPVLSELHEAIQADLVDALEHAPGEWVWLPLEVDFALLQRRESDDVLHRCRESVLRKAAAGAVYVPISHLIMRCIAEAEGAP